MFAKAGFGSLPGAVLKLAESTRGELKATEVERIKAELDKAMVANYQLRRDMSAIQRGRKIIEGELRAEIERLTP